MESQTHPASVTGRTRIGFGARTERIERIPLPPGNPRKTRPASQKRHARDTYRTPIGCGSPRGPIACYLRDTRRTLVVSQTPHESDMPECRCEPGRATLATFEICAAARELGSGTDERRSPKAGTRSHVQLAMSRIGSRPCWMHAFDKPRGTEEGRPRMCKRRAGRCSGWAARPTARTHVALLPGDRRVFVLGGTLRVCFSASPDNSRGASKGEPRRRDVACIAGPCPCDRRSVSPRHDGSAEGPASPEASRQAKHSLFVVAPSHNTCV